MVKKQKNFNWWFLILAVVAIVALVLAAIAFSKANMTGQGIFNLRTQSNIVNAHSCSADEICETNSIHVGEEGYVDSKWKIEGLASLSSNTLSFYDMVHNWTLPSLSLMSKSDNSKVLIFHGGFDVNQIVVNEQLKLISETGNNNAYACFNAQGVIYRSESPCI